MSDTSTETTNGYQPPEGVPIPVIYAWPPRPLAALRWLSTSFLFPMGAVYIGLAVVTWTYLTPNLEDMAVLAPGWMAMIWLRNASLLIVFAGGLHWWLHIRRAQGRAYKYESRWLAKNNPKFLWRNQARDNMFWSLVSGCTIWSIFEGLTFWAYANDLIPRVTWSEAPVYLSMVVFASFFWGTFHFYWVHRWLHWHPLYRLAHELHHRNVDVGPWSGISMHPVEHVIYFSGLFIWWIVPADPIVLILTGFFYGLSPALSHSGFDKLMLSNQKSMTLGLYFHQLHHQYFEVNYGQILTPVEKLYGTWASNAKEAQAILQRRRKI